MNPEIDGQVSCASSAGLPDPIRAERPHGEDRPQPSRDSLADYPSADESLPTVRWLESVARRGKRSDIGRYRQGATRLGMPLDEYTRHVLAGFKWCSGHKRWCLRSAFGPHARYPDGLNSKCRETDRRDAIERGRRKRAAAKQGAA